MLWDCFCAKGKARLQCIEESTSGAMYIKIWNENLISSERTLIMDCGWAQHDIDPKHPARGNKGVAQKEAISK